MIIPISVCYYSELSSAVMSYSGVQFATNESSIGRSDVVIKHKRLCLVKY